MFLPVLEYPDERLLYKLHAPSLLQHLFPVIPSIFLQLLMVPSHESYNLKNVDSIPYLFNTIGYESYLTLLCQLLSLGLDKLIQ